MDDRGDVVEFLRGRRVRSLCVLRDRDGDEDDDAYVDVPCLQQRNEVSTWKGLWDVTAGWLHLSGRSVQC